MTQFAAMMVLLAFTFVWAIIGATVLSDRKPLTKRAALIYAGGLVFFGLPPISYIWLTAVTG